MDGQNNLSVLGGSAVPTGALTGGSVGGWNPNGQYVFPQPQTPCPCCGYCPQCGRSNPVYPGWPYHPGGMAPWNVPNYTVTYV